MSVLESRVIARASRVGGPIHGPVALPLERRIAFLVVILSGLVLDRGRIPGAVGKCKTGTADERPRGQHDSHNNVSHGHILGLAHCNAERKLRRPGTPHPSTFAD